MEIDNNTPFAIEAIPFKGPEGNAFVTIIAKGTFSVSKGGGFQVKEPQIPILYGDESYDPENGGSIKFEADIAPFKPRADIVLIGHAYAPPGKAVSGIDVSLRVGQLHKVLRVFGDRTWKYVTLSPDHATRPEPFTKMPLIYERAFGGIDIEGGGYCQENLIGRGFFSKLSKKIVNGKHLPNIEDPYNLIQSPKDHPKPVGYGFYGRAWKPRVQYLGTYDDEWRKQRAPDPPPDFKYDYYNAAHPDLQWPDYLKGGEAVELINLSPKGKMRFQLPAISLTCIVHKFYDPLAAYLQDLDAQHPDLEKIQSAKPEEVKIGMNLDTLCLMPDDNQYYLLWRGRCPVYDLTALEVTKIFIA